MNWREAVSLSSFGTAERECKADDHEPWRIQAWISRRNRRTVRVYTNLRQTQTGPRSMSSTKQASKYDDWYPVRPRSPLECLAIAAQRRDDQIIYVRPHRRRRRKKKSNEGSPVSR